VQDKNEDDELNLAFDGRKGRKKKKQIGMKGLDWMRN